MVNQCVRPWVSANDLKRSIIIEGAWLRIPMHLLYKVQNTYERVAGTKHSAPNDTAGQLQPAVATLAGHRASAVNPPQPPRTRQSACVQG